jgi:hypothetical protein
MDCEELLTEFKIRQLFQESVRVSVCIQREFDENALEMIY